MLKKLTQFVKNHKKPFLIALVLLVGVSAVVIWKISQKPQTTPITNSAGQPSEQKIDKNKFKWVGGPTDPKFISIPTIGTEGFIQKVGIDQHKEVGVPSNIFLAGWFTKSVSPGQKGLSIIDGHVDGRTSNVAIFTRLKDLKKDDTFTVELGNGEVKTYKVIGVVTVSNNQAANVLFSQSPKVMSQLNLITCGGVFDRQSRNYDKRVIVQAALQP